jgi:predicted Zn-dependent protease
MTPFYDDVEIERGVWLGEWLHDEIDNAVLLERNGFFPDQVARVGARLQANRPPNERYVVEIPWISLFTAFTAPGRYVYFSRRLLERCPTDEAVAFVIAHEIAHHDLDHFGIFRRRFARRALKYGPGTLLVLFFRVLQNHVYSPKWETAADLKAIELCLSAGYDSKKCIGVFDVLEKWALYHRDFDAVYGLDESSDEELSPEATLLTRIRIWLYLRRRGYLPIQDRRALVQRHADVLYSPSVSS